MAPANDEVVVDRLYPGDLQLRHTLPHLVEALEKTLDLKEAKGHRTVLGLTPAAGR